MAIIALIRGICAEKKNVIIVESNQDKKQGMLLIINKYNLNDEYLVMCVTSVWL